MASQQRGGEEHHLPPPAYMSLLQQQSLSRLGNWSKEKLLGTGGFGTVVLWTNTLTKEELALKECRWGHDSTMTAKHRQRWKLEVDIMRRLNHPNVVKALEVPPELDVPGSALPVMAMEYCRGGDLRKMLNKPENCCGLPEKQVRVVLRHVVSAVEYLHCMRIIHRDLKPENIVVQQQRDGKCFYKLIDLGYAKELDQGSLCTSFVGTLQYLAPELFLSQTYTSSVDYWSLGLVSHEVITGQRPFLPNMSPAQWIPVVRHKSSDDIRAYLNEEGKVAFSKEICPCNQISSPLKVEIERWLRLLLEFEPKPRGRRNGIPAFQLFSQIKEVKMVEVFSVEFCRLMCYPVNEGTSLSTLSRCLERDLNLPVSSQLLLLPKGLTPDPAKSATQCCFDPEDEDEGDNCVFLFNSACPCGVPMAYPLSLPPLVEKMLQQPTVAFAYEAQKAAWRETVSFSQKQLALYNRLLQAFKVNLLHLLRKNSVLHQLLVSTRQNMDKLEAKCDLFKTSLHQDLSKFANCFTNPELASESMQQKWNSVFSVLDQMEEIKRETLTIYSVCTQVAGKALEPQKSPFARNKHSTDKYEEIHRNILLLYEQLRKRNREERKTRWDNTEMIELVCDLLQFQETTFKEIYEQIGKIDQTKSQIDELCPRLESAGLLVERLEQKVVQAQLQRQDDIWGMLNYAMEKLNSKESSSKEEQEQQRWTTQPGLARGQDGQKLHSRSPNPPSEQQEMEKEEEGATGGLRIESSDHLQLMTGSDSDLLFSSLHEASLGNSQSLSSILMIHTKDSQKVRRENETLRNELDSMLSALTLTQRIYQQEDIEQ